MEQIKNALIVGLGAIGSIYAVKIQNFNPNGISILTDEQRYKKYSKNGIYFNNIKYDFNLIKDSEHDQKFDLIIIATKANGFEKAAEMITNFIHEKTIILSLLNGIHSEKILLDKYPNNVLYSYFLGHSSMRLDNKITHDGVGKIFFGEEINQTLSERTEKLKMFFEEAKIDYEIPIDMLSSIWQKFVINVGVNQTCAIKKEPFKILHDNEGRKLATELMQEALLIAKKLNIKGHETFIETAFKYIDKMDPSFKPSMLQDVENNTHSEVDIFAGEVSRLGKKLGIKTPKNDFILKTLD